MTIKVGDRIPSVTINKFGEKGPEPVSTDEFFKGRRVVLFALPGAFTPTCSAKHVPGYVQNFDKLKGKGVAEIACLSVNDPFVMNAWGKAQNAEGKVTMLADGSAKFTKAVGLEMDLTERGMGVRSKRYAMLVEDGVVKSLQVEENPGGLDVSSAEKMLTLV